MIRLIGLAGPMGSGKSTIAAEIAELRGWQRLTMKQGLAEMLAALWRMAGVPEAEIDRKIDGDLKRVPDETLCGMTPTWAQQSLGTEWGRNLIGQDVWVNLWKARAERALAEGVGVVQESVRAQNEVNAIHDLGGKVICLAGRRWSECQHSSEHPVTTDRTVDNSEGRDARRVALEVLEDTW